MYDARERAIQDREWELDAKFREGRVEGRIEVRIEMIQTLQRLAGVPVAGEDELRTLTLEQLQALTEELQVKLRSR